MSGETWRPSDVQCHKCIPSSVKICDHIKIIKQTDQQADNLSPRTKVSDKLIVAHIIKKFLEYHRIQKSLPSSQ
jgi:hypothetical protein